ncbi:HD domain-containing phosphohydrolase [Capsulimonas corticalis]|nr:HD domain-containing phosphohydrolase [Capsulimonas corticalis]
MNTAASISNPQDVLPQIPALDLRHLLATSREDDFEDLMRLTAHVCGAPIALLSLRDGDRLWFKARIGLDLCEIPYQVSFCQYVQERDKVVMIPDTLEDARVVNNPFVTSAPYVRFYAGTLLISSEGVVLGTLCVVAPQPQTLSQAQQEALLRLARQAVRQIELRHSSLQTVVDTLPILLARVDRGLRYVFVNKTYEKMLGIPREKALGLKIAEVLGETAFESLRPFLDRALAGEAFSFHVWMTMRIAGLRYMRTSYTPEFGSDGKITGILISSIDVTERKHTEEALLMSQEALRESEATLRSFYDSSAALLGVTELFEDDVRFVSVNDATAAYLGRTADQVSGRLMSELDIPDDIRALWVDRCSASADTGLPVHFEYSRTLEGKTRWLSVTVCPMEGASFHLPRFASVAENITERKRLEAERERTLEEAVHLADHDPVTGLLNHRAFHRRLVDEEARARRERFSLAVLMMDMDNFKFFNDAYGHPAGDDVLRQIAGALRSCCRGRDVVARFGGDEFAMLMPGAGTAEVSSIKLRIQEAVESLGYRPPGYDTPIPLRLSVGGAVYPHDGAGHTEVLEAADARLMRAKADGIGADDADQLRASLAEETSGFTMLDALVTAVDNKDRYTRRHSEDVMVYSVMIARELGMDAAALRTIAVAALLHDLGKIGVPDKVLRKPGRLTEEEYDAVKQHPMMGAVIVASAPGFEETLDAVRHHHERWDGKGYPGGLAGEECPLIARLMAVADAFSAMTTDRPYRKGMPHEKALAILQDGAGSQWDPQCVAAFIQARARTI